MEKSALPIMIGITGHRDLIAAEMDGIRDIVRSQLQEIQLRYPHSSIFMLNSLAEGADMLCAEVGLELGFPLICVLPMDQTEYEKDFSPKGLAQFRNLLAKAESVFVSPNTEPEMPGRDFRYRQAGLYIAQHCQILMALWDGDHSKKDGCGTSAAVYYALHGSRKTEPSFVTGSRCDVLHISVNRSSSTRREPLRAQWLVQDMRLNQEMLEKADQFNEEACGIAIFSDMLLPDEALDTPVLRRLNRIYQCADQLSISYQRKYTKTLLCAAMFCVSLVLFYLLYDELEMKGFLLFYGLIMAAYGFLCRWCAGKLFLEKYLQYRQLAEASRVQLFLCASGQSRNASDSFTWTQKQDTAWIHSAMDAVLLRPVLHASQTDAQIRKAWIHAQKSYHHRAAEKNARKDRLAQSVSLGICCAMILSFFVVIILEFYFETFMVERIVENRFFSLSPQGGLKILWGLFSAATLFLSDYLGKLSLSRRTADHKKMELLFSVADEDFERFPDQHDLLFWNLAKEELIENGNWYSYTQENTPSFDL